MTGSYTPPSSNMRGPGLALVGYRGSGKTTIGQLLAELRKLPFLDLDHEIEVRAGQSISAIFAASGEAAFRDWEERTLREIQERSPGAILASGGGAVIRPGNRQLLRAFGLVIWLQAEPDVLASRIQADLLVGRERPALTSAGALAEIGQVLAERKPLYEEVADAAIDTRGRTPLEIASLIQELWSA